MAEYPGKKNIKVFCLAVFIINIINIINIIINAVRRRSGVAVDGTTTTVERRA